MDRLRHLQYPHCLTLVKLNKDAMRTSNFQPIRLQFTYLMTNSADPDQLASSEANWSGSTLFTKNCLLRQGISCLAREGLSMGINSVGQKISNSTVHSVVSDLGLHCLLGQYCLIAVVQW